MSVALTRNAIEAVVEGGDLNLKPVVQVLDVRPAAGGGRYKLLLSDGISTHDAILASQLAHRVKCGALRKGSVVQLIDYLCADARDRRIIMILNMEIIRTDCQTLGSPNVPLGMELVSQGSTLFCSSIAGHPAEDSCIRACNSIVKTSIDVSNVPVAKQSNRDAKSFNLTVQPSYRPPTLYKNRGTVVRNEAPARIIPISALNPYLGRWAIKVRVTSKGDLRRYNNAKGDGKVFSFDVIDSDGGEIRITCFNAVVDRFYDLIDVGKVYLISKGSLKPSQKNYNHLNNEWEIFLDSSSTVDLSSCEDESIAKHKFCFRKIDEIVDMPNNSILDIVGVVISVNQSVTITRKNGMETQRRILNLKDETGLSMDLTLWGDFCNREGLELQGMVNSGIFPVVAVKSAKVNDFAGKSIGTISSTQLFVNPDLPEFHSLRQWFDGGGKYAASQSVSRGMTPRFAQCEERRTILQIKEQSLGRSNKPDWIAVKANITFVKTDNFCYTACPLIIGDRKCSKKVTNRGDGKWYCDRCDMEIEECDYRYLLQLQVQDHTGLTWVTAFQEAGEEILSFSAKDLYSVKYEKQDDVRFAEIIQNCLFVRYLFWLKIKEEMFGDEQRVKISVIKAERVNASLESTYLLNEIALHTQDNAWLQ